MFPSRNRTLRHELLVLLVAMLALLPRPGRAQGGKADSVDIPGLPPGRIAASQERVDTAAYHPTKSPGKAMLLSAILPGAGQFYNESYWKVPVVVGFGAYFVYNWVDNNKLYKNFRDQYRAALVLDPKGDLQLTQTLLNNREFYKDQRDSFTWYLLIWYFITLADAYVDASLYDFNVGSDLSLQTLPVLSPVPVKAIQLTVHIGF